MVIDEITQYILAIVPAVTALVGMIVTVGVGIGTIRKANNITADKVERISKGNKELKHQLVEVVKQNEEVKKENVELAKALVELNKKIDVMTASKREK